MKSKLTIALIICSFQIFAQKVQRISLDRNKVIFSLEAGVIAGEMTLDGNAKYYNIWYNQGGYSNTFPDYKTGIPFHLGGNIEWHPLKNPGILGFGLGVFFDSFNNNPTYITHDSNFAKNPLTDTIAAIKQQGIGVPVFLKLRLGKFKLLDEAIFIKAGVYLSYTFSTELKPISVNQEFGAPGLPNPVISDTRSASNDFTKLSYYPYWGIEYRTWRITLNLTFNIVQFKKLLASSVTDYNSSPATFEKNYATYTVQFYLK